MRLTRSVIQSTLCSELGLSRRAARDILSAFTDSVTRALAAGDDVRLRGFGTFTLGRGTSHPEPPRRRVRFTGSQRLRAAVRAFDGLPDPALAALQRHLDSLDGIDGMLERHRAWCEDPSGERPDLARLALEGTDLFGARLRSAKLTGAGMSRADLGEADLQGADLERADLTAASLAWANLQGANLRGACLKGADMRWADLRNADLSNADLMGANLREALLDGARLDPSFGHRGAGHPRFSKLWDHWRAIRRL